MNNYKSPKPFWILAPLLLAYVFFSSCGSDDESELMIQNSENSFSILDGELTIITTFNLNRSLGEQDRMFYLDDTGSELGSFQELSDTEYQLELAIESGIQRLTPVVAPENGVNLLGETVAVSYSGNNDYWVREHVYQSGSNEETIRPFVFENQVILAGYNGSAVGLNVNTGALTNNAALPNRLFIERSLGFQSGSNGYIGQCIWIETSPTTIECSEYMVAHQYDPNLDEWSLISDTVDILSFNRQSVTSFKYNDQAFIITSGGAIFRLDEENRKWIYETDILSISGASTPVAGVIDGFLYFGIHDGVLSKVDVNSWETNETIEYPSGSPTFNDLFTRSFILGSKLFINLVNTIFMTLKPTPGETLQHHLQSMQSSLYMTTQLTNL